jgi:hypothetical protein
MTEALEALERVAFSIPAPNPYTPQIIQLVVTMRAALSAEPVDDRIGKWLSAALEDSSTCAEMKADIEAWFATRAERET